MIRYSVNTKLLQERKRIQEGYNELIRALKSDDAQAAKKALVGISPQDLGLTDGKFRSLAYFIDQATKEFGSGLGGARLILGMPASYPKTPDQQTTATHNPVTGKPWSSRPNKSSTTIYSPRETIHGPNVRWSFIR
jgi:hypothetical protein